MLVLLFIAVAIFAFVAIRTKQNGGKESPEDRELKSRAGAALGNALPPAFGGQSSSFLPMPDMTDRIEPENTHVARYEERVPEPESDHPFRKAALPRERFAAPIELGGSPTKPAKKKKRKKPTPVEPEADG